MSLLRFAALALVIGAVAQIPAQGPERREERRIEFAAALENGTLRVGTDCSVTKPCVVRFGSTAHAVKAPARVKAAAKMSGQVLVYIEPSGEIVAGSTVGLQCDGCRYARGVTQFPANSIPLFTWTVVEGAFTTDGGRDFRAELATKHIAAGAGVMVTENAGTTTVAIDPAVVSSRVITPPKSSASPCTSGDFSVDADYYYVCVAANKWKRIALSNF